MTTIVHSINLPKIVQNGWGHHVDFCVCKNRPLLLAKGVHLVIVCWGFTYKISHGYRSLDLINDKSTLVQVMVWFRQAASYYPRQCWQIWVAILRHNVLSNCHTINGDSHISDPFLRGKHRWQMVLTKTSVLRSFFICFVVSLNNLLENIRFVICLAAQDTLAIMNVNCTIQRWEIIHDHFV